MIMARMESRRPSTEEDVKKNRKRVWETLNHDNEVSELKKLKDEKREELTRIVKHDQVSDLNEAEDAKANESSTSSSIEHDLGVNNPRVLWNATETDIFKWYDIREVLGSGGFATTHLCIEKATGLKYACKVIDKKKLITDEDRKDVRLEVTMMKHLPVHQNVIELLGAYEDEHKVYLVMELCEGGELFEQMVNIRFYTERGAAVILKDIIQAVKVCHEHSIIHRDLKPENLLYTSKEKSARLKIIDFGLSTFFTPGQRFQQKVGTVCYMAPEVFLGNYGKEVDIWSAGVILYILLSGDTPFDAETDEETEHAILGGDIDLEGTSWREISEEAKDLVRGMLNYDPKERLTVQQILASLAGKKWRYTTQKKDSSKIKEEYAPMRDHEGILQLDLKLLYLISMDSAI